MDTHFEPINWGMGEIHWFKRATGERARTSEAAPPRRRAASTNG